MNNYLSTLYNMIQWFEQHDNDKPRYYEFTMRELITKHTYKKMLELEVLNDNGTSNILRLIQDNMEFIDKHMLTHNS